MAVIGRNYDSPVRSIEHPWTLGVFVVSVLVGCAVVASAGAGLMSAVLLGFAGQLIALRRRGRLPGVADVLERSLRSFTTRALPLTVGAVVLVVACDWGLGALIGPDRGTEVTTLIDLASVELPPSGDPRVESEAMAGVEWADRYFAELKAVEFRYVPYVGYEEVPTRGRYITTANGVRASYRPARVDDHDTLEVWFFGGSTLWGEGQRDLHTIPSEVVRLAERDGLAIRALNFGRRGFSAMQEFHAFERALAHQAPPDLAVFYHGFNELSTQTEAPENLGPQPTLFQLGMLERTFNQAPTLPGLAQPRRVEPTVARDYRDTSVVHRVLRSVGAVLVPPVAAQEGYYIAPPEDVDAAVGYAADIYQRSMTLIDHAADVHDVPTAVFWQPGGGLTGYDRLTPLVAGVSGGVDLSDVLDDPGAPIFIDGGHTNELGAQIVAAAIWEHMGSRLDPGGDA